MDDEEACKPIFFSINRLINAMHVFNFRIENKQPETVNLCTYFELFYKCLPALNRLLFRVRKMCNEYLKRVVQFIKTFFIFLLMKKQIYRIL